MGQYFNPSTNNFKEAVNREIFVDKSLLIKEVHKSMKSYNKLLVVSRPRRFGKTYNAEMLNAYFNCSVDSSFLFDKLKIAKYNSYKENLNKLNVLYFSLSAFNGLDLKKKTPVEWMEYLLGYDAKETFGDLMVPVDTLGYYLDEIVKKTN